MKKMNFSRLLTVTVGGGELVASELNCTLIGVKDSCHLFSGQSASILNSVLLRRVLLGSRVTRGLDFYVRLSFGRT
jgi:hypothetical protein